MQKLWIVQNIKGRLLVACGAGLAYGNMIGRVLMDHFGPTAGLCGGLAAVVVLAFGFYLNLDAIAHAKDPAEDR